MTLQWWEHEPGKSYAWEYYCQLRDSPSNQALFDALNGALDLIEDQPQLSKMHLFASFQGYQVWLVSVPHSDLAVLWFEDVDPTVLHICGERDLQGRRNLRR